jgi:peroxiredoxin
MAVVINAFDYGIIDTNLLSDVNLVVSLPAAFSDTCTKECVPGILGNLARIKAAGAKSVTIVCSDQPFAIAEWVKLSEWKDADVTFASDFGAFQLRDIVGRVSEEEGKMNLPRPLGDLLRRAYLVVKNGEIIGRYIETDSLSFTLTVEELLNGIRAVATT